MSTQSIGCNPRRREHRRNKKAMYPPALRQYRAFPKLLEEKRQSGSGPFRLLDLPGEIRNRIYEFALVANQPFDFTRAYHERRRNNAYGHEMQPRAKLMRVNKQLHFETARIFYGKNEWKFVGAKGYLILFSWLRNIGPNSCALVEKVTILNPWFPKGDYAVLDASYDRYWQMRRTDMAMINAFRLLEQAMTPVTVMKEGGPETTWTGLRSLPLVMPSIQPVSDSTMAPYYGAPVGYVNDSFWNDVNAPRFPYNGIPRDFPNSVAWAMLERLNQKSPRLTVNLVRLGGQPVQIGEENLKHSDSHSDEGETLEQHLGHTPVITKAIEFGWNVMREEYGGIFQLET